MNVCKMVSQIKRKKNKQKNKTKKLVDLDVCHSMVNAEYKELHSYFLLIGVLAVTVFGLWF